jgi:hypothetical protein
VLILINGIHQEHLPLNVRSSGVMKTLRSIMAIPYTGLFIAAVCNSRSNHGQYTRSSTEHLQYGAVTSARLLGQNY